MRVKQSTWTIADGWSAPLENLAPEKSLVLAFGSGRALEASGLAELSAAYERQAIIGCSTAGEIAGTGIMDDSLVVTGIEFEETTVRSATVQLADFSSSHEAGVALADKLVGPELAHVFVISDGLAVNGSQLAEGMRSRVPAEVAVTGGLAADGERFDETTVLANEGNGPDRVRAVGLYGSRVQIGYGCVGGWDAYGPRRRITRSDGSVLYELDGQPALELYKKYLGDQAKQLPASGLLFPLSVAKQGRSEEVVRTILSVDEASNSLTFAGDVPEGATARLMKANFDRLVDGAAEAAGNSRAPLAAGQSSIGILVSCVGRRLVLKQRAEEELEAVKQILGPDATLTGFYSYGEISPVATPESCELHNQTMTVTTLAEA